MLVPFDRVGGDHHLLGNFCDGPALYHQPQYLPILGGERRVYWLCSRPHRKCNGAVDRGQQRVQVGQGPQQAHCFGGFGQRQGLLQMAACCPFLPQHLLQVGAQQGKLDLLMHKPTFAGLLLLLLQKRAHLFQFMPAHHMGGEQHPPQLVVCTGVQLVQVELQLAEALPELAAAVQSQPAQHLPVDQPGTLGGKFFAGPCLPEFFFQRKRRRRLWDAVSQIAQLQLQTHLQLVERFMVALCELQCLLEHVPGLVQLVSPVVGFACQTEQVQVIVQEEGALGRYQPQGTLASGQAPLQIA